MDSGTDEAPVGTPVCYGVGEKYNSLQNSVFVGSEIASTSDVPGQFLMSAKSIMVFNVSTTITIGEGVP